MQPSLSLWTKASWSISPVKAVNNRVVTQTSTNNNEDERKGAPSVQNGKCAPCRCARVALVITVVSGARVQAIKQLNEHHVIHARRNNTGLNLCSAHLMCEHQVLSRMNFKPLSRSRFRVLTHIQAFSLLSGSRSCLVRHTNNCSKKKTIRSLERDK